MSRFVKTRIRCKVQPSKTGELFLTTFGSSPTAFKAAGMQFELGFFDIDGALMDVSNIASITLTVKPDGTPSELAEMNKSVVAPNINNGLTLPAWDAGTDQHAVISFLGSETNIAA